MEEIKPKSAQRQRQKRLINEVKDLLEFYFSPVNLSKDKFMIELLGQNPYIDLDIFLRFNKVKSITSDIKIIKKAVKKSSILELSENGSQVKRSCPPIMKENETECTIYVENLPINSTHEWLKKVFGLYGTIDYISLPKFSQTGHPKGFAFIEFHTPQEAQKAVEAFGGLASLDGTLNPAELLTIKTFGQAGQEMEKQEDFLNISTANWQDNDQEKEFGSNTNQDDNGNPRKKPRRGSLVGNQIELESNPSKIAEVSTEKNKEAVVHTSKKKKRKRSKKGKQYEPDSIYLKVMWKKDWKALRNKYLNQQRENMRLLKWSMKNKHDFFPAKPLEPSKSRKPVYTPDLIVKVILDEPLYDTKKFREGLLTERMSIAYIDTPENPEQNEIYIRFKSSDGSRQFLSESLWKNASLLTCEDEKEYWDKIFKSWESKRPKKGGKYQKVDNGLNTRGRDKLLCKVMT